MLAREIKGRGLEIPGGMIKRVLISDSGIDSNVVIGTTVFRSDVCIGRTNVYILPTLRSLNIK